MAPDKEYYKRPASRRDFRRLPPGMRDAVIAACFGPVYCKLCERNIRRPDVVEHWIMHTLPRALVLVLVFALLFGAAGCYASHEAARVPLCPDQVEAYTAASARLNCPTARSMIDCAALCAEIDHASLGPSVVIGLASATSCDQLDTFAGTLCP